MRKLPWKSCSTTHLPFLSSNPKILKAFLKTFPTKMKPTKCSAKEKQMRQDKWKKREERKWKVKVKTAVSLLNFLNLEILLSAHAWTSQANILHLDRRLGSVRPVNSLWYVSALNSTTVTRELDQLQNAFFGKISRDEWVICSFVFFQSFFRFFFLTPMLRLDCIFYWFQHLCVSGILPFASLKDINLDPRGRGDYSHI